MTINRIRPIAIFAPIFLSLSACQQLTEDVGTSIEVDVLIANGSVFSGIGGDTLESLDVGIKGDKIFYVGDAEGDNVDAAVILDASGLIAASTLSPSTSPT